MVLVLNVIVFFPIPNLIDYPEAKSANQTYLQAARGKLFCFAMPGWSRLNLCLAQDWERR